MKIGNAIAWGGSGKTLSSQAHGGKQIDARPVMAGGMEYEESHNASVVGRYTCNAIKKNGEHCQSWVVNDGPYCQGHLQSLQKLEAKIAACKDEAERIALEDERIRKWL